MTYKKQTWKTGEIITEGKLNHIEDGIATNDSGISDLDEAKTIISENILNLQKNKANQSEVDEIQTSITSIDGEITSISNEVDTLQTSVSSNSENILNLQNALPTKQDKLTAGDNISISDDNVISASGGGSVPDNMVTTDTIQSITATKTFSSLVCDGYFYVSDASNPLQKFIPNFLNNGVTLSIYNNNNKPLEFGVNTEACWFKPFYGCSTFYINEYSDGSSESGIASNVVLSGNIKNKVNNVTSNILTQGNVTAENNISVTATSDGIKISGPSNNSIWTLSTVGSTKTSLSWGASGSKYSAPANGRFAVEYSSSNVNEYVRFYCNKNGINRYGTGNPSSALTVDISVDKGDEVALYHNVSGYPLWFYFIPANGS